ncbi:hypothetical protein DRJ19_03120 [Candidatus Woesearchaeota archaeon]|nr:MAG: hypothetical protein DRJ19_03120 [Candidatus Woesearchaeota archaeon]
MHPLDEIYIRTWKEMMRIDSPEFFLYSVGLVGPDMPEEEREIDRVLRENRFLGDKVWMPYKGVKVILLGYEEGGFIERTDEALVSIFEELAQKGILKDAVVQIGVHADEKRFYDSARKAGYHLVFNNDEGLYEKIVEEEKKRPHCDILFTEKGLETDEKVKESIRRETELRLKRAERVALSLLSISYDFRRIFQVVNKEELYIRNIIFTQLQESGISYFVAVPWFWQTEDELEAEEEGEY